LSVSVIKRLVNLLSDVAREMNDSLAARKQAEAARHHLEGLGTKDATVRAKQKFLFCLKSFVFNLKKLDPSIIPAPSADTGRIIDPKEHDALVEQLKRGLLVNKQKQEF